MRAILERHQSRPRLKAVIVVMLLLLITLPVLAQSGGAYNLEWNTSDGGGGTFSTGGDWSLGGTVGQPDADSLAGGVFTLSGGFWAGGGLLKAVFLPLIVR